MKPPSHTALKQSSRKCWEACTAALLEMPISSILDAHAIADQCDNSWGWWTPYCHWLNQQGYKMTSSLHWEHGPPPGYSIAVGPTPDRPENTAPLDYLHAVVTQDGNTVYDPADRDPPHLECTIFYHQILPL